MMNLKSLAIIAAAVVCTVACSSGQKDSKADQVSSDSAGTGAASTNTMRTGNGTGTGTGSNSGSGTGTQGTGTGPGVNSDTSSMSMSRDVPNGTGTVPNKTDTGIKKGQWPTQGRPMN